MRSQTGEHVVRAHWRAEWPSVLLVVGWVAMGLLWPSPVKPSSAPPPRPVRPAYPSIPAGTEQDYVRPDLFGLPSAIGFRAELAADDRVFDTGPVERIGRLHFLPRRPDRMDLPAAGSSRPPAMGPATYRPQWTTMPWFAERAPGAADVALELSDALRARDFQAPDLRPAVTGYLDFAWQLVLTVELAPDGRPESVFLEEGSAKPDLNETVIRALLRGRASPAERATSGSVCVFGGMP